MRFAIVGNDLQRAVESFKPKCTVEGGASWQEQAKEWLNHTINNLSKQVKDMTFKIEAGKLQDLADKDDIMQAINRQFSVNATEKLLGRPRGLYGV
jgi:hypothetical protein